METETWEDDAFRKLCLRSAFWRAGEREGRGTREAPKSTLGRKRGAGGTKLSRNLSSAETWTAEEQRAACQIWA